MLVFNLKKEWFEKIRSGNKTHEYREAKPYWVKRLSKYFKNECDLSLIANRYGGKNYINTTKYIKFACGYPDKDDKSKNLKAKVVSISIVNGLETDLKKCMPVYDLEFELIKEQAC